MIVCNQIMHSSITPCQVTVQRYGLARPENAGRVRYQITAMAHPSLPARGTGSPGKSSTPPRSSLHPRNGAQSARFLPRLRATALVMAYRRKQAIQRSATFVEDHRQTSSGGSASPAVASPRATRFADDSRRPDRSSCLAAQAMATSSDARGDGDLTLPSFSERLPTAAAASQCAAEPSSPVQVRSAPPLSHPCIGTR